MLLVQIKCDSNYIKKMKGVCSDGRKCIKGEDCEG